MEVIFSKKISLMRIVHDTSVDGPGLRTSVYCAGCRHHCPACHNPKTWDFNAGTPVSPRQIWEAILEGSPDSNITFSGGDPLYQVEAFTELAKIIKSESDKTIWCYTGFTFEEIVSDKRLAQILPWIDVLVDGPFVLALRDENARFRGSSNQRLIDVPETLRTGVISEWRSAFALVA